MLVLRMVIWMMLMELLVMFYMFGVLMCLIFQGMVCVGWVFLFFSYDGFLRRIVWWLNLIFLILGIFLSFLMVFVGMLMMIVGISLNWQIMCFFILRILCGLNLVLLMLIIIFIVFCFLVFVGIVKSVVSNIIDSIRVIDFFIYRYFCFKVCNKIYLRIFNKFFVFFLG